MREPCVYILTNFERTVLYTGVTANLPRRLEQHAEGVGSRFVRQYKTRVLVYVEFFPTMIEAIEHEKRIKSWKRTKKVALIEESNPEWRDLTAEE